MTDIAIIAFILLIAVIGWQSGAINMLGSLGSLVAGYLCARSFSATLALMLTERFPSLTPQMNDSATSQLITMFIDTDVAANRIVQVLCFIIIFIVVAFLIRKICNLISGVFKGTLLGLINSGIGAGLGFFLAVLLIGIIVEIALPSLGSFAWSGKVTEFFNNSAFMMSFVHDMLNLFVANIPAISIDMFK